MSLELAKVHIRDLLPGMYVSRLDRPWLETPYKIQGFLIKTEKDIDRLNQYCDYVYIDTEKSLQVPPDTHNGGVSAKSDLEQKEFLIDAKPIIYEVTAEFKDELGTAHEKHQALLGAIKKVVNDAVENRNLDYEMLQNAVMPMINSVIRNPDAFIWLTMMKDRDNYTYNHMVSSSIWAAAFGRNLGLPVDAIQMVSLGALLFDIGKIQMPEKLISKPGPYNKYEINLVRQHVKHSVDLVAEIDGVSERVVEAVATHHERHDGSGYPEGIKANAIPLFGRMAGIIDYYDAVTSDRYHIKAISPHAAVNQLYASNGKEFQEELVEQFIQVVGVYPVGTLVELSDGRVGVVVSHQKVRRLRPNLMMILDCNKQFYKEFKYLNLIHETNGEDGEPIKIARTVDPGKYGIDPKYFYL